MPIFRKATETDIEQIATLEGATFTDAWSRQSLQDTFGQKQAFLTVAETDGKLLGYCIIYYVADEGEIARVAVAQEARRQGVGCALLNYTCDCCNEKAIERLLLDVRESNIGARAFYEQYGFIVDGVRKNFYDNPKENAVLMSKTLV